MSVSTSSKNAIICQTPASLSNNQGVLTLTRRKLTWLSGKNTSGEPPLTVSCSNIDGLFASKPTVLPPKLRIKLITGEPLTFSLSTSDDMEKLKFHLGEIVTRNKDKISAAAGSQANGPSASAAEATAPSIEPGQGSSYQRAAVNQKKRLNKNELKAAVLMRSPELARLHADLVRSGHITEAEFWEGREHLILAEAAADSQRRGKSSLIVDPRPVRDETGKATTKLSNEMIEEIFEEFPVVRQAYDENVGEGKKLSDQDFWSRYLQSKLASRNSASARGMASEHTVKVDLVFDKYLGRDDDAPEPQNQRDIDVQKLVDLDTTAQDHPETQKTLDVTMQAGRIKVALPLIRRFNEHSERLLNAALGPEPQAKRRKLTHDVIDDDYVDQIIIDELQEPQSSTGIPLEMKSSQSLFDGGGRAADAMVIDSIGTLDLATALPSMIRSLDNWAVDMNQVRLEKKAAEDALGKMTTNVRSRLEVKGRKNEFPDAILNEMTSLQTATSEFLRQFWSAVNPPQPDQGALSVATPTQLNARKQKMAGYLLKTEDKVKAIAEKGPGLGVDSSTILAAFHQTMIAVKAALQIFQSER